MPGVRVFSSASDAPRVRRPTDLVLLVVSFLGIVAFSLVAPGPTALDQAVSHLVSLVPGLAGWFWEVSYDLLIGWALLLTVGPLVVRGRRRLLLDALLAALLSFGFAALARRIGGTSWSAILGALLDAHPPAVYPAIRLAVATAIVATASPHIARPLRYIGALGDRGRSAGRDRPGDRPPARDPDGLRGRAGSRGRHPSAPWLARRPPLARTGGGRAPRSRRGRDGHPSRPAANPRRRARHRVAGRAAAAREDLRP